MNNQEALAGFPPAPLEDWYRYKYFQNEIDISGSGVQEYSFADARRVARIDLAEFDQMTMGDGPTVGTEATRRAIAERFANGDAEMVMITNGSNEALQLVVRSLVKSGDEIISPRPCYHCHDKIAASIGCEVRYWDLKQEEGFAANLGSLERLVTQRTRAMILNFPGNPTGVTVAQSQVDQIVELCRSRNIYLLWDAAFHELLYDNRLIDPVRVYEKAISVGTFSKAYGLPGLRFGWIIAQQDIIRGCVRQKDYGNLYVAPLLEHIARKVLIAGDEFVAPRLEQARINRELVDSWIQENSQFIRWNKPGGGVCCLVKIPSQDSDVQFCTRLLSERGVLLVPGSCFDTPGYVRLGFGGESAKLRQGLERLSAFLHSP